MLEGKNIKYESLPAKPQKLSFGYAGRKFRDIIGVRDFDSNVLKMLSLFSESGGHNNAACILADQNDFPGIDIARFGENISIIRNRKQKIL